MLQVFFSAYLNSAAASKTRQPEPVFRWDPFQGASIWYLLGKLVMKYGRKVLFCFVKKSLITYDVHYKPKSCCVDVITPHPPINNLKLTFRTN